MTDDVIADTATAPADVAQVDTTPPATPVIDVPAPVVVEPTSATEPPRAPEFAVPDEYKDKGWVQKIKAPEDLWKQLDAAQSLIGKKSIVPEFGTPQEKLEYLAQFKPQDKAEYEGLFPERDMPTEAKGTFTDVFDKANLTSEQAKLVLDGYFQYEDAMMSEAFSVEGWQATIEQVIPNDTEKRLEEVVAIMRGNVSENRREIYNKLPNEARGLILEFMHNISAKYGVKPEHMPSGVSDGNIPITEKRQALQKALVELKTRPHTQADKQKILDELVGTYKQ